MASKPEAAGRSHRHAEADCSSMNWYWLVLDQAFDNPLSVLVVIRILLTLGQL